MYFVPTDGRPRASMLEDLADLFEQAAADGTPIREIVGEDPVEFVEAFAPELLGGWLRHCPCAEAADRAPSTRAEEEDTGSEGISR